MAERARARRGGSTTRRSRTEDAGGRLNRDYGDEEYREPSEGYQGEQPTKGLYTCELFEIRDHQTQDGNESVRWGFRLVDGSENKHGDDVSGWPDFQYTTENTAWKEQQMLVALGVIKPGGKVNLGYDAIVKKAKPCTVRVGVERYIPEDGGEGEWRGRMNAFLPLRDGAPAKSRRAKDDDPVEDVFDGDEDEAEEDEEPEEKPARTRRSRKAAEPEPEEDEDEEDLEKDEVEDYDPDELAAELEDLTLVQLKRRARDEFGVKIARGMSSDDIIEAVLETLDEDQEDEEEEPEEEPEPPKRRTRAAAKTSGRRTRKHFEPPF